VPVNPSPALSGGVPAGDPLTQKVTYDFGVPTTPVTVLNPTPVPNPPPQPSLPYLVGVYAVDRAAESPAYQRILFYFRGGFPSYQFGYVDQLLTDVPVGPVGDDAGDSEPTTPGPLPSLVPVPGSRFVQFIFFNAQAHDGTRSTVAETPPTPTTLPSLRSAVQVSDANGKVRYGLGIDAPAKPVDLRVGEATYGDGAGGTFSVVWLDVRTG
jgi:hypothetical protein